MKKHRSGPIEWLEFDILQEFPQIKHGVFLRGDEFDLSDTGKEAHKDRVLELMGLKRGVKLKQCHETSILEVTAAKNGWSHYEDYDGMVTREKGVALMTRHADCQTALFFDPEKEAIANIHCGWRGNVKNIYSETIKKMHKLYGTNPKDLKVCISPSLGPTKAEFINYRKELPRHFWKHMVEPNYFDFWAISTMQLCEAGVLKPNIEIAGICTYSNPENYFSYRRDPSCGRHGTIVALTNNSFSTS